MTNLTDTCPLLFDVFIGSQSMWIPSCRVASVSDMLFCSAGHVTRCYNTNTGPALMKEPLTIRCGISCLPFAITFSCNTQTFYPVMVACWCFMFVVAVFQFSKAVGLWLTYIVNPYIWDWKLFYIRYCNSNKSYYSQNFLSKKKNNAFLIAALNLSRVSIIKQSDETYFKRCLKRISIRPYSGI